MSTYGCFEEFFKQGECFFEMVTYSLIELIKLWYIWDDVKWMEAEKYTNKTSFVKCRAKSVQLAILYLY